MRGPWPLVFLGVGDWALGVGEDSTEAVGADLGVRLGGVGGAVAGDEFHGEVAEDVIHQRLGHGDFSVPGHSAGLESDVLEFSYQALHGYAVLEADRYERGDGVHQAADGAAFFGHPDEDFAGLAVFVEGPW